MYNKNKSSIRVGKKVWASLAQAVGFWPEPPHTAHGVKNFKTHYE